MAVKKAMHTSSPSAYQRPQNMIYLTIYIVSNNVPHEFLIIDDNLYERENFCFQHQMSVISSASAMLTEIHSYKPEEP